MNLKENKQAILQQNFHDSGKDTKTRTLTIPTARSLDLTYLWIHTLTILLDLLSSKVT